ncbi:MAG: DUF1214 domain-containing protein [Pseudomonas sp.]
MGTKNKNLKRNADGSLTIYVGPKSPGKDKESNWLPSPKEPFSLYIRAYWGKEPILDGSVEAAGHQEDQVSLALQLIPVGVGTAPPSIFRRPLHGFHASSVRAVTAGRCADLLAGGTGGGSGACLTADPADQQRQLARSEGGREPARRAVLPARGVRLHDHAAGAQRDRHAATVRRRRSAPATTCCRSGRSAWIARTMVPTPNADVIYSMSYLDLKETGPLVVAGAAQRDRYVHRLLPAHASPMLARSDRIVRVAACICCCRPATTAEVPERLLCCQVPDLQRVPVLPHDHEAKGEGKPDPAPAVTHRRA